MPVSLVQDQPDGAEQLRQPRVAHQRRGRILGPVQVLWRAARAARAAWARLVVTMIAASSTCAIDSVMLHDTTSIRSAKPGQTPHAAPGREADVFLRLRGRELVVSERPQAEAQRDEQHAEADGVAPDHPEHGQGAGAGVEGGEDAERDGQHARQSQRPLALDLLAQANRGDPRPGLRGIQTTEAIPRIPGV